MHVCVCVLSFAMALCGLYKSGQLLLLLQQQQQPRQHTTHTHTGFDYCFCISLVTPSNSTEMTSKSFYGKRETYFYLISYLQIDKVLGAGGGAAAAVDKIRRAKELAMAEVVVVVVVRGRRENDR